MECFVCKKQLFSFEPHCYVNPCPNASPAPGPSPSVPVHNGCFPKTEVAGLIGARSITPGTYDIFKPNSFAVPF